MPSPRRSPCRPQLRARRPAAIRAPAPNIKVQKLLGGPGKNLTATCQKKSGKPVDAVLTLPCGGDIRNENGSLVCKSGPNPFAPPPGSYMAQCKNADMAGPILQASCKASDGSRVDTTINTLDCRGRDISVKPNGKLTCKRGDARVLRSLSVTHDLIRKVCNFSGSCA
ncbi:MAG TPA: CVNH domain-containing protein [Methyloceanibacter sp.]|nr:CVNH domain-containing protein [Methyloceanibacter sp.]